METLSENAIVLILYILLYILTLNMALCVLTLAKLISLK